MAIKQPTCVDCLKPESECVCIGITSTPVKDEYLTEHLTKMDVARILGEFWIKHPRATIAKSYAYFFEQGVENERSK